MDEKTINRYRSKLRDLYIRTQGRSWEPAGGTRLSGETGAFVDWAIEQGYLRRVDGRVLFEALPEAMFAWTDAGVNALAVNAPDKPNMVPLALIVPPRPFFSDPDAMLDHITTLENVIKNALVSADAPMVSRRVFEVLLDAATAVVTEGGGDAKFVRLSGAVLASRVALDRLNEMTEIRKAFGDVYEAIRECWSDGHLPEWPIVEAQLHLFEVDLERWIPRGGVRNEFRAADDKDWDRLFLMLDNSGHGRFWQEILSNVRRSLKNSGDAHE